jgi:glycosyltransferase involved in cell wall biosynthesis
VRILLSDFVGHPFQLQLSRELARRSHEVRHTFVSNFQTPQGKLEKDSADPEGLSIVGVTTRQAFAKHSLFKRRRQDIEVGHLIAEQIADFAPDVVISGNAPLDTQKIIQRGARQVGAQFVFWVQDVYSEAMGHVLRAKLGPLGAGIARSYRGLERRLLRKSDHVVVISSDFEGPVMAMSGLPQERISVIENWAPLEEVPLLSRDNEWAAANLPQSGFRAVYSGTLGYKHNPELLLQLARALDGHVIVFSEGPAADHLKRQGAKEGLSNLHVAGWLPFEKLPSALAGADLLVVILEEDAGVFAVPSKVLTYMCAGRAILGSIPSANLAARIIRNNGAGAVVEPADQQGFVATAQALAADAAGRLKSGAAARAYAERTFDIDTIGSKFERIISGRSGRPEAAQAQHQGELQHV